MGSICVFCCYVRDSKKIDESAWVRSNVREFSDETFDVWRCGECGSIACASEIDHARYYRNYPIQRQRNDFFARRMFTKRLHILRRFGLEKGMSLLDYGCGSGLFVEFCREKGWSAEGYDPYSTSFSNEAVLERKYDFVLSQDVLEHVEDPSSLLTLLKSFVAESGVLVTGMPIADRIQIGNSLDAAGVLHQPYHRNIPSSPALVRLLTRDGWNIRGIHRGWYVDTLFPFVNSNFLFRYFEIQGGHMDAGFEPFKPLAFLKRPSLAFYGVFGGLLPAGKDMVCAVVRAH